MADIESTLATLKEEMLQNLQFMIKNHFSMFYNDAVMQIKSNIKNREMKFEETKQEQEIRYQASTPSFIYLSSCFVLKIGDSDNDRNSI